MTGREHTIEVSRPPAEALRAVRKAADLWGADFEAASGMAGRLRLGVVAGLRRGWVAGALAVEPAPAGARVAFRPEEGEYFLHWPTVAVLLLAAGGGLLVMLWPFFPRLIAVAPFGAVLALAGWFLVLSRLRNSGPEDFLRMVAAMAEETAEEGIPAPGDGL